MSNFRKDKVESNKRSIKTTLGGLLLINVTERFPTYIRLKLKHRKLVRSVTTEEKRLRWARENLHDDFADVVWSDVWQAVCIKIRRRSDVDVRIPHVDVRLSDVDVKAQTST